MLKDLPLHIIKQISQLLNQAEYESLSLVCTKFKGLKQIQDKNHQNVYAQLPWPPLHPSRPRVRSTIFANHTNDMHCLTRLSLTQLLIGCGDGSIVLWDIPSNKSIRRYEGHTKIVNTIAKLDDQHFVSASYDLKLYLWNINQTKPIKTFEGHNGIITAVLRYGSHRFVSASWDKTVRIWDTNELPSTECQINSISDSKDSSSGSGSWVQAGLADNGNPETINPEIPAPSKSVIIEHPDVVSAMVFDDQGRLVTGSWGGKIRVWDIEKKTCLSEIHAHTGHVDVLCNVFGQIVSASKDTLIKVWDTKTYHNTAILSGHEAHINCVIGLSKTAIMSVDAQNNVAIWDIPSRRCVQNFETGKTMISALLTSGKRVLSLSEANKIVAHEFQLPECASQSFKR